MRALLQRVRSASVEVQGECVGTIGRGLLVFLGVGRGDTESHADRLADKVSELRIFPDERHAMNRSLKDVGGEVLVVSQFTLYADCRRGRRPSFDPAEAPGPAESLYGKFVEALRKRGMDPREGVFREHMIVRLENDGPVTILLENPPPEGPA